MDLYILPKNIKQVFSAFADHDPLLLTTLAILENFIWEWYQAYNNDIMYSF